MNLGNAEFQSPAEILSGLAPQFKIPAHSKPFVEIPLRKIGGTGSGNELLTRIRTEFPSVLRYHPKSKKFVESPDNFWVVRVQPRA